MPEPIATAVSCCVDERLPVGGEVEVIGTEEIMPAHELRLPSCFEVDVDALSMCFRLRLISDAQWIGSCVIGNVGGASSQLLSHVFLTVYSQSLLEFRQRSRRRFSLSITRQTSNLSRLLGCVRCSADFTKAQKGAVAEHDYQQTCRVCFLYQLSGPLCLVTCPKRLDRSKYLHR